MTRLATIILATAALLQAQTGPIRVIAFGAHPDDCDIRASGLAAKYAAAGHKVKFVSVTNGDAGHFSEGGGMLAARRRAEAKESGRRRIWRPRCDGPYNGDAQQPRLPLQ